ncbi:hypothetical protein EON79_00305 [bacterium]|nr:MAG: hypothetical protein EON79_00305 [bacterium]
MPRCQLCERDVPTTTVHHLVPKQVGRRKGRKIHELPTADLCSPCHKQLHALFPNRELSERLASVEDLRRDESVSRFLNWLRKQPAEKSIRVRR